MICPSILLILTRLGRFGCLRRFDRAKSLPGFIRPPAVRCTARLSKRHKQKRHHFIREVHMVVQSCTAFSKRSTIEKLTACLHVTGFCLITNRRDAARRLLRGKLHERPRESNWACRKSYIWAIWTQNETGASQAIMSKRCG